MIKWLPLDFYKISSYISISSLIIRVSCSNSYRHSTGFDLGFVLQQLFQKIFRNFLSAIIPDVWPMFHSNFTPGISPANHCAIFLGITLEISPRFLLRISSLIQPGIPQKTPPRNYTVRNHSKCFINSFFIFSRNSYWDFPRSCFRNYWRILYDKCLKISDNPVNTNSYTKAFMSTKEEAIYVHPTFECKMYVCILPRHLYSYFILHTNVCLLGKILK